MNKNNNSLIFLIIIFCFFFNIYSKRKNSIDICPNKFNFISQKDSKPQIKDMLRYYQKNKTIEYNIDGRKLSMNFTGINQYESENPSSNFQVIYSIKFYDKEKLGIDEIKAPIECMNPLLYYSLVKVGEETRGKINWEVKVEENNQKNQVAQIVAEASLEDIKEIYIYDSFIFNYTKKDEKKSVDNTEAFWFIFFALIASITLTFGVMYVYFYATIDIGRDTLRLNNISTGFNESLSSQDIESKPKSSRTTA